LETLLFGDPAFQPLASDLPARFADADANFEP
jgi:hypothetical protein